MGIGTTLGYDATLVTESDFGILQWAGAKAHYEHAVFSDGSLKPTLTAGTRSVVMAPGAAFVGGVYVNTAQATTAQRTVTFAAGATRRDLCVLEVNWATNETVYKILTSTSAYPTPQQAPGNIWQMPICRGVADSNVFRIEDARPQLRRARTFRGTDIVTASIQGTNPTARVISSVDVPDPGSPYILQVTAQLRVSGDAGYGHLSVTTEGGLTIAHTFSGGMTTTNGSQPIVVAGASDLLTGSRTVELYVVAESMNAGSLSWNGGPTNHLTVVQSPA